MEEIKYSGKIIQVITKDVELANGTKFRAEIARRSPGVRLIILDKSERILITKESRQELNGGYDHRLPGGKVFDDLDGWLKNKSNEDELMGVIRKCVEKECLEEVGLIPTKFDFFHKSILGSTQEWDLYYYIVTEFETNGTPTGVEGEDISVMWVDMKEAEKIALEDMSEERSAFVLLKFISLRK